MASCKKIVFITLLLAFIPATFAIPLVSINWMGEKRIHDTAQKIAAGQPEPESVINEIIKWENRHIKSIYQRPHSSYLREFYVLPELPFTYARFLNSKWIMFFKRGACEEYAKLFTKLATAAGLDNARVVLNLGVDHAWAEVRIGENWIHVDPSKINPITKERGIVNDPEYYERPENENGEGRQLFFVYAIDDTGGVHDVTSRYVKQTAKLIIHVEQGGKPVANARVTVTVKNGYGSASFLTDENGTCMLSLGNGSYTITAESGEIIVHLGQKNIYVEAGHENHVILALVSSTLSSSFLEYVTKVLILVTLGILAVLILCVTTAIVTRRKMNFVRLFKNTMMLKSNSLVAGVLLMIIMLVYAVLAAVGILAVSTLTSPQDGLALLWARIVMFFWISLALMGIVVCVNGVRALLEKQIQLATRKIIGAAAIGVIFSFVYSGFGLVLGLPTVLLSSIGTVLLYCSNKTFW